MIQETKVKEDVIYLLRNESKSLHSYARNEQWASFIDASEKRHAEYRKEEMRVVGVHGRARLADVGRANPLMVYPCIVADRKG